MQIIRGINIKLGQFHNHLRIPSSICEERKHKNAQAKHAESWGKGLLNYRENAVWTALYTAGCSPCCEFQRAANVMV